MHRGVRLAVVVLLALGVVVLTGCAKVAEKATEAAVEKATGVKVDQSGENVTVTTDEGEATLSSEAKLPADFPADVPLYDNATITSAMTNKADEGMTFIVAATSDDDAATIFEWYKKAFEDKGWEIKSTMEVGDSVGGLSAEKNSQLATLSIGYGDEKKADMTITVTPN